MLCSAQFTIAVVNDGAPGAPGKNGVGITSVTQTTTLFS